jgi:lysine biosynthesis protein LysW
MRTGRKMITSSDYVQVTKTYHTGRLKMPKTRCPNCDITIKMEEPREGIIIICPGCGVELEVINADPFEVDFTDDWQDE